MDDAAIRALLGPLARPVDGRLEHVVIERAAIIEAKPDANVAAIEAWVSNLGGEINPAPAVTGQAIRRGVRTERLGQHVPATARYTLPRAALAPQPQ